MKYITTVLLILMSLVCLGQASSSSDFNLRVTFDESIKVGDIYPYYFLTVGNKIDNIHYEVDEKTNSMRLFGHNSYILHAPFPIVAFTLVDHIKLPERRDKVERTFIFYLVSQGPVTSYRGRQTKEIIFSYDTPIITTSLELIAVDVFEDLKIESTSRNFSNLSFPIGTEMIKIESN